MGGENESVLKADKKDVVLKADDDPKNGNILQPDTIQSDPPIVKPDQKAYNTSGFPQQYQSIRQHVSAGQVHFHDDSNKLKASIPVADWYVILRQLKTMTKYTYVDTDFNCTATFRPFINNGTFEVAVELIPIVVGERFKQLNALAKR